MAATRCTYTSATSRRERDKKEKQIMMYSNKFYNHNTRNKSMCGDRYRMRLQLMVVMVIITLSFISLNMFCHAFQVDSMTTMVMTTTTMFNGGRCRTRRRTPMLNHRFETCNKARSNDQELRMLLHGEGGKKKEKCISGQEKQHSTRVPSVSQEEAPLSTKTTKTTTTTTKATTTVAVVPQPTTLSLPAASPLKTGTTRTTTTRTVAAATNTNRRRAMATIGTATIAALLAGIPNVATAAEDSTRTKTSPDPLEDVLFADGRWVRFDRRGRDESYDADDDDDDQTGTTGPPPYFCTYLARIVIQYDAGVASWWRSLVRTNSLVSDDGERRSKLGKAFGAYAKSLEDAILDSARGNGAGRRRHNSSSTNDVYTELWDTLIQNYPNARRHIEILFTMLPYEQQPVSRLSNSVKQSIPYKQALENSKQSYDTNGAMMEATYSTADELTKLLPFEYHAVRIQDDDYDTYFAVEPAVPVYAIGIGEEFGQTATATPFGPLGNEPLVRERPRFSLSTYALFALSGATGCALTHSIVIPLDVVKTRNQVDSKKYPGFFQGSIRILQEEGLEGLFLGAQATIAGFFWYGLSVYPSYTFFKRFLSLGPILSPEVVTVHANDIALIAGALASVVASLGLTPLEAARIRVVADPDTYRPEGLSGTLSVIATEDTTLGWKALYAGLPSLLTRQVIFGSVKFLAFERACDLIFGVWPFLRDLTWTSLMVSFVAGGLSGTLSSIVSQPADSVLTYVAQNREGSARGSLSVIDGCKAMIEKEGIGSLFNGLGSRCIWAGSIIAGQFFLYDIFRTLFHVNSDDLAQVYQMVLPVVEATSSTVTSTF